MKKSLISFAIAAFALLAPAAMTAQTTTDKAKTENRQGTKKDRGEVRQKYNPFEGLNLTDAQQSKLKDLGCPFAKGDKKGCPDGQQCKPGEKKDQNGQTARPSREEMAKKKIDARKDYLAKVKQILTPQQYLQFLENSYTNRPGMDGRKHSHNKHAKKHHKNHKDHKMKGQKGQKAGRGNNTPAAQSL